MEIPTLETERLILRPFNVDDIDTYAAMVADTEVSKLISLGGKPMDRLDAWRSMTAIVGQWQFRSFGQWAVEEKETGTFLGHMGLYYPET